MGVLVVVLSVGVVIASCGEPGDELAVLEVLVVDGDAECSEGECFVGGEAVQPARVLARAVESPGASRFAPEGIFVLASWEQDRVWAELELDLPLDQEGHVDLRARYSEHREGEALFVTREARGRIVLLASPGMEAPFAAYLELRFESEEGEARRLHLGHLEPDDGTLPAPGPLEEPVDWSEEGVELVILEAAAAPSSQPPNFPGGHYHADYRLEPDPYVVAGWGCSVEEDDGCEADEPVEGDAYYPDDGSGSCEGDDFDDPYYDDSGGCEGDDYSDDTSFCSGDDYSDDDYSDDASFCSGDDYSDDYYSDDASSCEGDDWSGSGDPACEGDDWSGGGESFEGDCEGDVYEAAASRHRRQLVARARGIRPPSQARRAASFFPIVLALLVTRLFRTSVGP